MKTTGVIFAFIAAIAILSGCDKDNKDETFTIVGTWEFVSYTDRYNIDGNVKEYTYPRSGEYFEFKGDGTLVYYTKGDDNKTKFGTYSYNEAIGKLSYELGSAKKTAEIVVKNNKEIEWVEQILAHIETKVLKKL